MSDTLDLSLPKRQILSDEARPFLLAANDADVSKVKANISTVTPASEFEPPFFSGSNAPKYLGIGTVVLAGLTAMSAPEGCEGSCPATAAPRETNGSHAQFAKATVALAAATIATGLYAHWDDFSTEDGWSDPDNLHVLLGISGAALMAYAVNKSASSATPVSHAAVAELGALGMVVAIKLTW
ncbi:MAG: hypothetical protein Q8O24_02110 [Gallionellaceae bacterium]|nr:hypothetical protein [Gallionellaceae bacterium]